MAMGSYRCRCRQDHIIGKRIHFLQILLQIEMISVREHIYSLNFDVQRLLVKIRDSKALHSDRLYPYNIICVGQVEAGTLSVFE